MKMIQGISKKHIYGSLVALALLAAPLPAFADSAGSDSTPPSALTVQTAPATEAPSPAPAPSVSLELAPTVSTQITASNPATIQLTTPPASDATTTNTQNTTATNTTASSVQNQINSDATSGNADVSHNYTGGNANSGNAKADATVVNVANSTTNFGTGSNFTSFTQDVYGDWQQNIIIDPTTLMQTSAAAANNSATNAVQNSVSLTDIINNIVLSANSGNATVNDNYQGGNATSGDAAALANVINIVGSSVGAQQSFLGIINIYGNLKGDILVPSDFVNSLLSGNGAGSNDYDFTTAANNAISSSQNTNTSTTIDNNIVANAASGNASVSDNYLGGNATSGNATTNITVFNLTGQTVVAKNSLLVFVNVLGKWVGMILNAPGSTTALLGDASATQNATSQTDGNIGSSSDTTTHITNNISVGATSGDASVTDNRTGGNATSGKASAGVNLLNITNSNFVLGDWFGALFINVLGSWAGNFGVQPTTASTSPSDTTQQPIQDVKVFQFQESATVSSPSSGSRKSSSGSRSFSGNYVALNTSEDAPASDKTAVLGASTSNGGNSQTPGAATRSIAIDVVALVAMISALTLLLALGSFAIRQRFAHAKYLRAS